VRHSRQPVQDRPRRHTKTAHTHNNQVTHLAESQQLALSNPSTLFRAHFFLISYPRSFIARLAISSPSAHRPTKMQAEYDFLFKYPFPSSFSPLTNSVDYSLLETAAWANLVFFFDLPMILIRNLIFLLLVLILYASIARHNNVLTGRKFARSSWRERPSNYRS
jgi:hypothetical protein